jgi:hypothetical protein
VIEDLLAVFVPRRESLGHLLIFRGWAHSRGAEKQSSFQIADQPGVIAAGQWPKPGSAISVLLFRLLSLGQHEGGREIRYRDQFKITAEGLAIKQARPWAY